MLASGKFFEGMFEHNEKNAHGAHGLLYPHHICLSQNDNNITDWKITLLDYSNVILTPMDGQDLFDIQNAINASFGVAEKKLTMIRDTLKNEEKVEDIVTTTDSIFFPKSIERFEKNKHFGGYIGISTFYQIGSSQTKELEEDKFTHQTPNRNEPEVTEETQLLTNLLQKVHFDREIAGKADLLRKKQ